MPFDAPSATVTKFNSAAITLTIKKSDEAADIKSLLNDISDALKAAGTDVESMMPDIEAFVNDAAAELEQGFGFDFGGIAQAFDDIASKFGGEGGMFESTGPISLDDMFDLFDFSGTDIADHLPDQGETAVNPTGGAWTGMSKGGLQAADGATGRIGDGVANVTGSTPSDGGVDVGKICVGLMMAESGVTIGTAGGAASGTGVGAAAGLSLVVVGGSMAAFGVAMAVDGTGLYDALGDDAKPKEANQSETPATSDSEPKTEPDYEAKPDSEADPESAGDDEGDTGIHGQSNDDGTVQYGQSVLGDEEKKDTSSEAQTAPSAGGQSNTDGTTDGGQSFPEESGCEDPDDDGAPTADQIARILNGAADPTGGAGDPEDGADDFFVFDNMSQHVENDLNGHILTNPDDTQVQADPTDGPSYDDMVGQPVSPDGASFVEDAFIF